MTMTRPTTEQITHKGQLLSDVLDRPFNLLDFGAVGDGVTDDMDALIAAVNAVKAAGGGTLYIPFTPNGYYLRYGTGCQLAGTNGISIISNNATLKLQGGTFAQTVTAAVFGSSATTGVQNLLIEGLRFESASTVLRYGNGSQTMHFEDEVDAGRADPNEQTSFRFAISLAGSSNNVTIKNCYFGAGILQPVKVTEGQYGGPKASNIRLQNLTFYGVSSSSILVSYINGLHIDGITDIDHKGSKFDWTLYLDSNLENVSISNVVIRQTSPVASFGTSAIACDGSSVNVVFSNILIDGTGMNVFTLNSTNVVISSLTIQGCLNTISPAINMFGGSNISISALCIIDCPWCIGNSSSTNVVISDFVCKNASRQFFGRVTTSSTRLVNGTVVDCGAVTNVSSACIGVNTSSSSALDVSNVRFEYATYVPSRELVDVRNTGCKVSFFDCVFVSSFGTASARPVMYTGNGATISIRNCSKTGWSVPLTYSGAIGAGMRAAVEELPLTEGTLTPDSATPSVLDNKMFVTANTTATAITNFTDGVQGQEICVRVNDANTTFDFSGSNLKGNNGVDYVATSGDLVFAKRIGSNWYCTVCEA